MAGLKFTVIHGSWAVVRFAPIDPIPEWAYTSPFYSITRTTEELCIVCSDPAVPESVPAERGWALIKLVGPIPFTQVGVLASVAAPLAESGTSIFAVSTYETDYILVKSERLLGALAALTHAGHALT